MNNTSQTTGLSGRFEISSVRRRFHSLFYLIFILSMAVNILMLTGPLYMLQVYDRVLGARSEETLVALSILLVFLFGMMGIFDYLRGRIAARIGGRFQATLDKRVFQAHLKLSSNSSRGIGGQNPLRDLEAVQKLMSSPVFLALFDAPWAPLFFASVFLFHPWLGYLAIGGGIVLAVVAIANQRFTAGLMAEANQTASKANNIERDLISNADVVRSLGMQASAFQRWISERDVSLNTQVITSDRSGLFIVTAKTLRLFLQSAMLGLGAWLVLNGKMTAGGMIASSILMGKALTPLEMVVGQWQMVQSARRGRVAIIGLLDHVPVDVPRISLPKPRAFLVARDVTVVPPGAEQASLNAISFALNPGQVLGIIGPSGAGKSSLAKAIIGVWSPVHGRIRLDGATLDQYDAEVLGRYIGYLPQKVTLFEGSIAENIARLLTDADSAKIVEAAKRAGAHDMILEQSHGYDTWISSSGGRLSGGQIQRIGLARAMYGDPVLLVLDEPNSNLDAEGTSALNAAIRTTKAAGHSVVIIAHRPAAIQECDVLLKLDHGRREAFGSAREVLSKVVTNHQEISRMHATAGSVL